MLVQEIGEQRLLKIVQKYCPSDIIGDDAAVIATTPEKSLVITTDVLVDNVHFSDNTTSASDAGWRSVAANLSDLAAMGAFPLGITVGLGLRGDVSVNWVEDLYRGMTECLQQYNTPILGGDIVRSPVITISITAFGQAYPHQIIRRDQAKVGDAIVVTGVHGASRAGLELLLHPEAGQKLTSEAKQTLILAHQRPKPRLDVLPLLTKILSQAFPIPYSPLPISGMDSSDGLADAIVQICQKSNVGAVIQAKTIPTPEIFQNWLSPQQALEYALYGGEDFELVLCMPKEPAETLVEQLGKPAAVIGTITAAKDIILQNDNGEIPNQVLTLNRGFQHFKS